MFFMRSRRHNSSTALLCCMRRARICASMERICSRRVWVVSSSLPHRQIVSSATSVSRPQYWQFTFSVVIMVWPPLLVSGIMLKFNMIIGGIMGLWWGMVGYGGHVVSCDAPPRHYFFMAISIPHPAIMPPQINVPPLCEPANITPGLSSLVQSCLRQR